MTTDRITMLRGIVPPMISPLLARDTLDYAGLERLVEHVVSGGVHGLFALGTTGEGPHLSQALRRRLIAATVRQVAGRVPVLVGISDTSFEESVALARYAADSGADAVVASAPYYFQASQDELFDYVRQLARDVPLPLVLYNIPQMTKVWFSVETIRRALELPNVVGIKDSSHDLAYFRQLQETVAQYPGTSLLMGPEDLLSEALRLGARGGVPGGANLFPRLFADLYEASQRDDRVRVRELHEDIMQMNGLLYSVGTGDAAVLKSVKCTLSCMGICQDYVAPPLQSFTKAEKTTVRERLEQIAQQRHEGTRAILAPRVVPKGRRTAAQHSVREPATDTNGSGEDGYVSTPTPRSTPPHAHTSQRASQVPS